MALSILRRTLTSATPLKNETSSLINFSHFSVFHPLNLFSTKAAKSSSKITEYLMSQHQLSPEAASSAASVLIHMKSYKNPYLILDYLKETGLSKTQLEDLLVFEPRVLACNLNRSIKPKVEAIRELGFSPVDLADLLSSVPAIITVQRAPPRLVASVNVLQSLLGSNLEVVKLLRACDWFLASDLDKTMMPNIELLKSCGISLLQIRQLIFSFPRFFLHKTELLRDCVRRVDEMGLSRDSKMFIHGIRAVSSMSSEKWESKLKLFRSLGFTDEDVLSVFRRTPQIFAISERKIKEVAELLITSGNVDILFVVQHPELLIYSAAHRIKPRLLIINILRSKGLLVKEPSLTSVCKMDDEDFTRKFVLPHASDIGEIGEKYMARRGLSDCIASV